jgi:hypothetical protein
MANKQHKTPCAQCPFRRTAAAGWLGGLTPDDFKAMADSEARMPCHVRADRLSGVDYAAAQQPGTVEHGLPQCAGRAIHWANQCKVPRTPGVLLELPPDPVGVFQWPFEFVAYHKAGVLAESETVTRVVDRRRARR